MKLQRENFDENYFQTFIDINLFHKVAVNQRMKLIKFFVKKGPILEIGCGQGHLLNELQKQFPTEGIDISEYAVEKTNKLIGKKLAKCADIENYKIRQKYQAILAFNVLEHLNNPKKIIKKIYDVLGEDSIFIFSVPNNFGLFGRLMTGIFNYLDKTHVFTLPRVKWVDIAEGIGFKTEIFDHTFFGIRQTKFSKYVAFTLTLVCKK